MEIKVPFYNILNMFFDWSGIYRWVFSYLSRYSRCIIQQRHNRKPWSGARNCSHCLYICGCIRSWIDYQPHWIGCS